MTENRQYMFYALLLGLLTMSGPIAVDSFLPMVPAIAKGLGVGIGSVEYSLTAIFAGNALGQIVYGPLSDRFGRKPIILLTLFIYFAAAIGAGLSGTVEALIFWRFIQGLIMASGRIVANAVARDLFEREKLAKLITLAMVIGIMSSLFSAPLGGYLSAHYSWQTVFWFMTIYSGFTFITFLVLFKETLREKNYRALNPAVLLENFATISRNRSFILNVLCGGFILSGLVAYLNSSSGVLIGAFGLAPAVYGLLYAAVLASYTIAALMSGKLIKWLGITVLVKIGAGCVALGGTVMLGLALAGINHAAAVLVPMAIFMIGFAFLVPQTIASALTPFPQIAGAASSLQGFIQNSMAAVVSALLAVFSGGSAIPMSVAIAICGLLAAATYGLFIRKLS